MLRFIPGSGSHSYIAVFAGTSTNMASTSPPQTVTVSPPTTFPTTTAITSTGSAGNYTLTATVVGTGNATLGPTSSVSFIDTTNSNSVLGAATLGPLTLGRGFADAPGSPIVLGSAPRLWPRETSMATAIADLAVAEPESNNVTIMPGNGDGPFTPVGSPVAVGADPTSVVVADFNSDSIADLAVTNYSDDGVSILKGNRDGTFTEVLPRIALGPGSHPAGVTTGNFNDDGTADLAVTNSNGVSILLDQVTQAATAVLSGVRIPGGGTHNVNASYTGDTNFIASTSQTIPLTATQVPTVTTLVLLTADTISLAMSSARIAPMGTCSAIRNSFLDMHLLLTCGGLPSRSFKCCNCPKRQLWLRCPRHRLFSCRAKIDANPASRRAK
jgi:hypothetical protein